MFMLIRGILWLFIGACAVPVLVMFGLIAVIKGLASIRFSGSGGNVTSNRRPRNVKPIRLQALTVDMNELYRPAA